MTVLGHLSAEHICCQQRIAHPINPYTDNREKHYYPKA